jgi:hypothetical protein
MLTEQITRLCAEIVQLRDQRGALMADLIGGNKQLKQSVADLCAQFSGLRGDMAKATRAERARFMKNLKHAVSVHSQHLQTDLAGARKAWASLAK